MTAVIIRMVLALFAILSCEGVLDAQAAFPTATVNISGTESYQDGVWDQRDIRIDFNGFVETVAYGQFSSSQSVAAAFAAKFSADYHSFGLYAKAGAPGTAPSVITFELTDGSNFGSLNVVDSATSFSLSSSGFTPTSLAQADIGVASLTINGTVIAVNYGSGSTASSIAQDLAANAHSSSSPVEVTSDGPNLYLRANASGGNFSYPYSLSFSSNQSFSTSNMSSGTLTSGSQVSPSIVYSYSVEDAKGHNGYQANGNLQNVADSVMGTWTYTYDTLNRLIKGTSASGVYSGRYLCWSYDTFGNRLSQSVSTTSCSANPPSTYSAAFNAKNQVNTVTTPANGSVTYDLAGNVTNDGTQVYVYDAEERICVVQGPEGMIGYQYNSNGIRVGKGTVTSMSSCDPAQNGYVPVSDYILDQDGDQLTEMSVTNGTATWLHTDVRANGSLVATYDTTGDGLHFYLNDAVGTRRVQTNAAGVPEQRCQSLPFGDQLYCSGSIEIPTEHHYTGKERDVESGLDYFGARYYGSSMGRFMSPDPSRLSIMPNDPQTWNRYTYGKNNPLRFIDDNGKWPTEIHNRIIDKAFPNLSPAQRQILKNISAKQDGILNGGQSEGRSAEHAMSSDSQSGSAAFNQFSSFVSTWETEAQLSQDIFWLQDPDAASQTQSPEALAAFGMALHAYEDSTSPAHEGFQTWRWYDPLGFVIHHFRENKISDAQMNRAVAMARGAFLTTFGVDVHDAGGGATVTTTQGDGWAGCGGTTGTPCPK